jgi:hypothetical protein
MIDVRLTKNEIEKNISVSFQVTVKSPELNYLITM